MRGIGHADQQFGRRFARMLSGDDVAGDALIFAVGIQAVGTRQIQQTHTALARRRQPAFFALDRHTGVIGHFLACARQQVEQGGLTAVRVAQQRGAQCRGFTLARGRGDVHGSFTNAHAEASTCTSTLDASWRRSANVA
ncbi:hypothetical protein D3C72_1935840 [compost metagenome]